MRENATIYRDNNIIKATTEQVEEDKEILFKIRKSIIDNTSHRVVPIGQRRSSVFIIVGMLVPVHIEGNNI